MLSWNEARTAAVPEACQTQRTVPVQQNTDVIASSQPGSPPVFRCRPPLPPGDESVLRWPCLQHYTLLQFKCKQSRSYKS
ncbi:unnamed protein product [Ixodes persulcatus]